MESMPQMRSLRKRDSAAPPHPRATARVGPLASSGTLVGTREPRGHDAGAWSVRSQRPHRPGADSASQPSRRDLAAAAEMVILNAVSTLPPRLTANRMRSGTCPGCSTQVGSKERARPDCAGAWVLNLACAGPPWGRSVSESSTSRRRSRAPGGSESQREQSERGSRPGFDAVLAR